MFPEAPGARAGRPLSAAWASLLLCGGAICPELAWAREVLRVDLSAGADVSSNPFLDTGGKAAVGAHAGVDANYNIDTERTQFNLGAAAHSTSYFDGRGTDLAANVTANVQHRVNARMSIGAMAHYGYSRSSGFDYLFNSAGRPLFQSDLPAPSSGATPAPGAGAAAPALTASPASLIGGVLLPLDTTLIGRRVGEHTWGGAVNLAYRTSERTTMTVSADANTVTYTDSTLADYRMFGQAIAISRRITEATSVTAQGRVSEIKYDNGEHDVIVTPMIGVERQLNRIFNLAVYGGASVVRTRLPDGTRVHASSLAVTIRLCGRYERGQLCFSGERQELPSALGGVRPATVARVIYNKQLNRNDSLDLGLSFDRRGRDTRNLFTNQTTLGGSARYEHKFGNRLSGYVSAGYVRFWESGLPNRSEVRGGIGIAYRFGDRS